ncbi:MAG TPA: hypothetical protein VGO29_07925 [Solirubrobacteraceae bacterium]|jgi:hypothetical protein|nr:hypothetical protein [Solirubrobacteraceae bacterium]
MRIALCKSRVARLAVVVALVALVCLAPEASADTGTKIIERCTHGQSLAGFSQQDYRRALQELPTEVEEYSDCANLIRRAQLAAAGGGGAGTGGGGAPAVATPLSPSERSKLNRVAKSGATPLHFGGQLVRPGVVHANIASAFSSLPGALLAVLAFLLACALALGGRAIGRSVRAHRSG